MAPFSLGIKDIFSNFTSYFAENQGKLASKYPPIFVISRTNFHFTPLSRTFFPKKIPIFTISRTLLNFTPISWGSGNKFVELLKNGQKKKYKNGKPKL